MFVDLPHRPGKFKAVHLRHHDVRHDEVIQAVVHLFKGTLRIRHTLCFKAAVVEIGADRLVQRCVIVYHKNMDHLFSSCCLSLEPRQSIKHPSNAAQPPAHRPKMPLETDGSYPGSSWVKDRSAACVSTSPMREDACRSFIFSILLPGGNCKPPACTNLGVQNFQFFARSHLTRPPSSPQYNLPMFRYCLSFV